MTSDDRNELLLADAAWLHALTRSMVADKDLAADVAQETLLAACRQRLSTIANLRPWLAAVAANLARRFARGERRRRRHEQAVPPRDAAPSTADVVAKASLQRDVVDAVLRLGEPYRTTLLLRFQEQLGYDAIAARMRVPVETVRTRVKRGLALLRAAMDAQHGEQRAWALPILGRGAFELASGAALTGTGVMAMGIGTKVMAGVAAAAALVIAWSIVPAPPAERPVGHDGARGVAPAVAGAPSAGTAAPADSVAAADRTLLAASAPAVVAPAAAAMHERLVRGRVVDAANRAPLADVVVGPGVEPVQFTPAAGEAETPAIAPVRTDRDGRFALDVSRSRGWPIEIVAAHRDGAAQRVSLGFALAHGLLQPFRAAGDEDCAVVELGDVPLLLGPRLVGRVLTTDGSRPVSNAQLALQRLAEPHMLCIHDLGVAGADGWFSLPPQAGSSYGTALLVAIAGDEVGACAFDVGMAAKGAPIEIRLLPHAELHVRVVDELGDPVPRAVLQLYPSSLPLGTHEPMIVAHGRDVSPFLQGHWRNAAADGAGEAVFASQPVCDPVQFLGRMHPAGAHDLHASAVGHRGAQFELALHPGRNDVQVVLPRGTRATVRGTVTDARTGQPIEGASIAVGEGSASTDAAGRFAAENVDLARGPVVCTATAADHADQRLETPVQAGGDLVVDFRLEPTTTVMLQLVDELGATVYDATRPFGERNDRPFADGTLRVQVGKDPVRVRIVPGTTAHCLPVVCELDSATATSVRVVLPRAHAGDPDVEFELVSADSGAPIADAEVALAPLGEGTRRVAAQRLLQATAFGARGRAVPPGGYELRAWDFEGRCFAAAVEVPAGDAVVRRVVALAPVGR